MLQKARRGSRGITLLFFNIDTRLGWVVSATTLQFYPQARAPVPIVYIYMAYILPNYKLLCKITCMRAGNETEKGYFGVAKTTNIPPHR